MFQKEFFYLIKIEYLGFRYHGWAPQPNVKTVQGMIEKTIRFVLGHETKFKVLGASRTDAMVSAKGAYFELFTYSEIGEKAFLADFNANLPQDINALSIEKVDNTFNIINSVKQKEYRYYFTVEKMHPFASPFMTFVPGISNADKMIECANLFEGEYDFTNYCELLDDKKTTRRKVDYCRIQANNDFNSDFFPNKSMVLIVKGKGFMRKQIRLMMGAIIRVGRGELTLQDIEDSLNMSKQIDKYVAPASGLVLYDILF